MARLIDADALINYCNNLKDKTIDANDIARFPTVGGWISVKDRMPPPGKVLLVARKYKEPGKKEIRYVEMGELMDDCTWVSDSNEYKINIKYHSLPYAWMQLPEPQKEVIDGDK